MKTLGNAVGDSSGGFLTLLGPLEYWRPVGQSGKLEIPGWKVCGIEFR